MDEGCIGEMGTRNSKIKGSGLIIVAFCCQLFNVAKFPHRRVVLGLITILFAGAAILPIAEQAIKSSVAAQRPVLMVLGDSLVAGHGLPQGEAFPEILGQMLRNDGFDVALSTRAFQVTLRRVGLRVLIGRLLIIQMQLLLSLGGMIF